MAPAVPSLGGIRKRCASITYCTDGSLNAPPCNWRDGVNDSARGLNKRRDGCQGGAMYRLETEFCGDANKATRPCRRKPSSDLAVVSPVIAPSENQTG